MTSNTDSLTLNTTLAWSPDSHTLTSPESQPRLPPDGHSSQARHPLQGMTDTTGALSSPGVLPGMPPETGPVEGKNIDQRRASASSFDPDDARESEPSPDVNLDFPSTEDVTAGDGGVRGMLGVGGADYVHPLAAAETAPGRVYVPPQSGSVRSRGRVPDPLEVLPFGEDQPHQAQSGSSRRRPPHSSYYNGPPPLDSAYGSDPLGQIGVHFPREILRIERDYSGGELVQFHPTFPLELEGRVTPVQHQESMNSINEILISAHQLFPSFLHNALGILTLYISTLFIPSHYDRALSISYLFMLSSAPCCLIIIFRVGFKNKKRALA
ncbi:hypothetical protein FRC07_004722 [Ceratobasidium sp. 392]|nr:hypothetical protein FRC07_004722 [Ceratobasidium sp. 392]